MLLTKRKNNEQQRSYVTYEELEEKYNIEMSLEGQELFLKGKGCELSLILKGKGCELSLTVKEGLSISELQEDSGFVSFVNGFFESQGMNVLESLTKEKQ